MRKLKIGANNFWDNSGANWLLQEEFLGTLRDGGIPVEDKIFNPEAEECDIVFFSVFGNYFDYIGNPIKIFYTGENVSYLYGVMKNGYSLSFHSDNSMNLYYPLWQFTYDDWVKYRKNVGNNIADKTKFCSFIVSNPNSAFRNQVFFQINDNYKKIDSFGKVLNNQGFFLPREFDKANEIMKPYKFNLCFENTQSEDQDDNYITEKIMNAYIYGSVPIYWGSGNVTKWFNPKSFINCNGMAKSEILNIVKYYDTHDQEYEDMLMAYPFNEEIDWKEYRHKRLVEFMKRILMRKGLIYE